MANKTTTTYTFDEYVQLCCTVSDFNQMEILAELLHKEALLFNEEEMLFLCDLAEERSNALLTIINPN